MTLDANLARQVSQLSGCPEPWDEIVAEFMSGELHVRGESLGAARSLSTHCQRTAAVLVDGFISSEHDQLFAGKEIGELQRIDLGQAHRRVTEFQIGEHRVLNFCRQSPDCLLDVLRRLHIFGGSTPGSGEAIEKVGVHVVTDAKGEYPRAPAGRFGLLRYSFGILLSHRRKAVGQEQHQR